MRISSLPLLCNDVPCSEAAVRGQVNLRLSVISGACCIPEMQTERSAMTLGVEIRDVKAGKSY